jgi:cytochrome c oxidase subunit IV
MTTHAAPTAHEETVHGAGHAHPGDAQYMLVALFLAVMTAIEVGLYYIDMSNSIMIPTLVVLMIVKFGTVAAWFMHLRFDSRLFRRVFVGGLILAILVYLAFLTAMQLWGDNTTYEKQSLPAAALVTV